MKRCAIIASTILAVCTTSLLWAGEPITIAGSSTVRPVIDQATKEFLKSHPDIDFTVGGGGSGAGVKGAGEGQVMIGMASRSPKDKEMAIYSNIVVTKIGIDGVAIFLNSKNPVQNLTKEQIQQIYTGQITNWSQVGGNDALIKLVCKHEDHGTHDVFLKFFGLESEIQGEGKNAQTFFKMKDADKFATNPAKTTDKNRETFAAVITNPNAIGYNSVGIIEEMIAKQGKNPRLALPALDGIIPSTATVASGEYKCSRPLNLITKGQPSDLVTEFIDFVLGPQGQKIISDLAFIPANPDALAAVGN